MKVSPVLPKSLILDHAWSSTGEDRHAGTRTTRHELDINLFVWIYVTTSFRSQIVHIRMNITSKRLPNTEVGSKQITNTVKMEKLEREMDM